ncbi:hypothetical protein PN467_04250 [Microcystis aeruginosa CS-563/04]|uniref:hypothetical protein n=1 Tax=Microcystis aeruginosa TaxID=1126 RepID=UPI00232B5635|nr:hypothetical protein [Microcystis aeruginosa]MDB9419751.1 hypothetical protein [Microcystis aeruginosa CS-563/04]
MKSKRLSTGKSRNSKHSNIALLTSYCAMIALFGIHTSVNAGVPLDPSFTPVSEILSVRKNGLEVTGARVRVTWAGNDDWEQCGSLLNSYRNRVESGWFGINGENWQCWKSGKLNNGSTLWTADIGLGVAYVNDLNRLLNSVKRSLKEHFVRDDISFTNY